MISSLLRMLYMNAISDILNKNNINHTYDKRNSIIYDSENNNISDALIAVYKDQRDYLDNYVKETSDYVNSLNKRLHNEKRNGMIMYLSFLGCMFILLAIKIIKG